MRRCCSLTLLLFVLSSCGGPAAPTQMPPPTVTPIVVTVTAQVVSNVVGQGIRGLQNQGITEARNVRVTGTVDVTGGSATVEAKVTFTSTPSNNNGAQQIDIEVVALSLRSITPSSSGGTPFDVDIPYSTHPVEGASGMVSVVVTGTDERGRHGHGLAGAAGDRGQHKKGCRDLYGR